MARPRKPSVIPPPGSWVRLERDLTTKGGMRFLKGLKMRVTFDAGGLGLHVYVRGKAKAIHLRKVDIERGVQWGRPYFTVISTPPPEEEEDPCESP